MPTQNNGHDCGVYVLHYLSSRACEVDEDPLAYLMTEGAETDQYDSIIEWTYHHFEHLRAMKNQYINTSKSWKLYQCETDGRKMN
eukprot:4197668-Ditylum_brightwellii.AAC.1